MNTAKAMTNKPTTKVEAVKMIAELCDATMRANYRQGMDKTANSKQDVAIKTLFKALCPNEELSDKAVCAISEGCYNFENENSTIHSQGN